MSKYGEYEYRKQPGFDMNTFEGAYQAIPMKTLVIHCFEPATPTSFIPPIATKMVRREERQGAKNCLPHRNDFV